MRRLTPSLRPTSPELDPVRLRQATREDQPTIHRLVHQANINPLDLVWQRFLLAVDEAGEAIGCGQVKPHRDGSRELSSIVVIESWRRRGVARALIERLMAEAGPPLWLTCRSGLVPLYVRFEFRLLGPDEPQPAYFRRVRRLAAAFGMLAGRGESLAVMVWEGGKAPGHSAL